MLFSSSPEVVARRSISDGPIQPISDASTSSAAPRVDVDDLDLSPDMINQALQLLIDNLPDRGGSSDDAQGHVSAGISLEPSGPQTFEVFLPIRKGDDATAVRCSVTLTSDVLKAIRRGEDPTMVFRFNKEGPPTPKRADKPTLVDTTSPKIGRSQSKRLRRKFSVQGMSKTLRNHMKKESAPISAGDEYYLEEGIGTRSSAIQLNNDVPMKMKGVKEHYQPIPSLRDAKRHSMLGSKTSHAPTEKAMPSQEVPFPGITHHTVSESHADISITREEDSHYQSIPKIDNGSHYQSIPKIDNGSHYQSIPDPSDVPDGHSGTSTKSQSTTLFSTTSPRTRVEGGEEKGVEQNHEEIYGIIPKFPPNLKEGRFATSEGGKNAFGKLEHHFRRANSPRMGSSPRLPRRRDIASSPSSSPMNSSRPTSDGVDVVNAGTPQDAAESPRVSPRAHADDIRSVRPVCPKGMGCTSEDPEHWITYQHTDERSWLKGRAVDTKWEWDLSPDCLSGSKTPELSVSSKITSYGERSSPVVSFVDRKVFDALQKGEGPSSTFSAHYNISVRSIVMDEESGWITTEMVDSGELFTVQEKDNGEHHEEPIVENQPQKDRVEAEMKWKECLKGTTATLGEDRRKANILGSPREGISHDDDGDDAEEDDGWITVDMVDCGELSDEPQKLSHVDSDACAPSSLASTHQDTHFKDDDDDDDDALDALLEADWFWGSLSSNEAIKKLRGQPPHTFLVRFSKIPGSLSISFVSAEGHVQHTRISQLADGSFQEAISGKKWADAKALALSFNNPNARTIPLSRKTFGEVEQKEDKSASSGITVPHDALASSVSRPRDESIVINYHAKDHLSPSGMEGRDVKEQSVSRVELHDGRSPTRPKLRPVPPAPVDDDSGEEGSNESLLPPEKFSRMQLSQSDSKKRGTDPSSWRDRFRKDARVVVDSMDARQLATLAKLMHVDRSGRSPHGMRLAVIEAIEGCRAGGLRARVLAEFPELGCDSESPKQEEIPYMYLS